MTTLFGRLPPAAELDELVACSLNEAGYTAQQKRWVNLTDTFGIARALTDDGIRLVFQCHPQVAADLRAVVDVENDCCSWASWSVERDEAGNLVVAARSHKDGVAALHAMFTQLGTRD